MTSVKPLNRACGEAVLALAFVALVATGCGSDATSETADISVPAVVAWSLEPQTILPIVPQDMKVTDGGIVWIADDVKDAVIRLDVPNNSYKMFGHDDTKPLEIMQPWRIAVSPDVGVLTFDGTSRNIDLFTLVGQYIRGFTPDFAPSYMDVTSHPISLVAATRRTAADSTQILLVLSSDLLGQRVDTLVGPDHGPESLRSLSPNPRETALAGSDTGLWIWTRAVADTVYGVAISGPTAKLVPRPADLDGVGMLFDRAMGIVWLVQPDSAGLAYAGYDVAAGGVMDEEAYIGTRTTPPEFTPQVAHEGLVIGGTPDGGATLVAAYDMQVSEPVRSEP